MSAHIRCEMEQGVAVVTISYPERFNAMSRAMWRELKSVFETIHNSPDLRCVRVVGEGAHFCAGGDISEYPEFRFQEASLRVFHEQDVWGGLSAMLACDLPIVAQISGNCMGAGVEIASCCDIRIAAASAKFGAPIARLGFPMAPREAALVGRELGLMTARQMLLEATVLDATEMAGRGFLTRVVADSDLAASAQATVQRMQVLAPQAARLNKQTLRALAGAKDANSLAMADELAGAYAYANGPEQREGISAFLDKRTPVF